MQLDIGIEQPHHRRRYASDHPLPHEVAVRAGSGSQPVPLACCAMLAHDMKFGHRRSPSETPEIAMSNGRRIAQQEICKSWWLLHDTVKPGDTSRAASGWYGRVAVPRDEARTARSAAPRPSAVAPDIACPWASLIIVLPHHFRVGRGGADARLIRVGSQVSVGRRARLGDPRCVFTAISATLS